MSKLLVDEYPLIVLPTLARVLGLNEAIFLQQLNYWLNSSQHCFDGQKWIYNTFEEWQKQLPFFTVITIKRIVKALRDQGIIITTSRHNKLPMDRTLWYSIDRAKLDSIILISPSYQNDTMPLIDEPPLYQNDTTIVSKRYDAKYQDDTSNNQRLLPETTTETTGLGGIESIGSKSKRKPQPNPLPDTPTPPSPHQQMFGKICELVGWDCKTIDEKTRLQLAQTAKILTEAGYTPADLDQWWDQVWKTDWRWTQKHSRPTLNQLRQEIGKVRNVSEIPVVDNKLPDYTNGAGRRLTKVEESLAAVDRVMARLAAEESGDDQE